MSEFEGVLPVVPTPFDRTGAVDHDAIGDILRNQAARDVDGVILFGIASEFYKLRDSERRAIVETAADVCADETLPFYVSVTDHATQLAVEFGEFAATRGADGLMVLPPFFLQPGEDQLLDHLSTLGRAVDVPLLVQYAPEQTGTPIQPRTLANLAARVDTIDHFKIESQPPGPYITALEEASDGAVETLVGYAGIQMIEAFDRGSVGVVSGCALSDYYCDIVAAYRAGDRDRAISLHNRLTPLLELLLQDVELFIHYEKKLLRRRGVVDAMGVRKPAPDPDEYLDALFEDHAADLLAGIDD
jgi:4-hydroxy-tetrahydrodipicolinate synthase